MTFLGYVLTVIVIVCAHFVISCTVCDKMIIYKYERYGKTVKDCRLDLEAEMEYLIDYLLHNDSMAKNIICYIALVIFVFTLWPYWAYFTLSNNLKNEFGY